LLLLGSLWLSNQWSFILYPDLIFLLEIEEVKKVSLNHLIFTVGKVTLANYWMQCQLLPFTIQLALSAIEKVITIIE